MAMNGYSQHAATETMKYLFRITATQPGANWYCGLTTSPFNPDGTSVVEPLGGAYQRKACLSSAFEAGPTSIGYKTSIKNDEEIRFIESTESWGQIVAFFMADSPTEVLDNIWFGGLLDTPKTIEAQTVAVFSPTDMVIATVNEGI